LTSQKLVSNKAPSFDCNKLLTLSNSEHNLYEKMKPLFYNFVITIEYI